MSAALRREWRRAGLAAAVAGLLAGPRAGPALIAATALGGLTVLRRPAGPRIAAGLATVFVLAAGAATARRTALEATRLRAGPVAARVTVLEQPRANAAGGGVRALASLRSEPVLLRLRAPHQAARTGSILRVRGRLAAPDRAARARHAHATLLADTIAPAGQRGGPQGAVDRIRERSEAALRAGTGPADAALLDGMVLGQDAGLPPLLADDFRATGLTHLTAASGQNVALLAALAAGAGMLLGASPVARAVLALLLIALYVPLAGSGPSIVRAGVMGSAILVATLAGRPGSRADALLLAAAVTLAADPRAAGDLGWQLSFAAVTGIAVGARPLAGWLGRRRMPRALAEAVAVTAAATVATAPVLQLRVGTVSPMTVPANVLAAPAVPAVMGLGAAAALIGQASPSLAAPLSAAAAVPAAYLRRMSGRLAAWRPPGGAGPAPPPSPGVLRVTALDVGQGDATLVETRGARLLVDTGPPGPAIARALRQAGARRLDLLVLTHPQLDHIGAAASVTRDVPVASVLDGRDGNRSTLSRDLDRPLRGLRRIVPRAGAELAAGPMRIAVLWPPQPAPAVAGDPNDRAVVLLVRAFGRSVLLTADAESEVLGRLSLPPVDVLKVAHHGSADPGLPDLLRRLRPRAALIEVGAHNRYGHPTRQALRALAAARVPVWRTDRDGTVSLELSREGVRVDRRGAP